jgi:hypothetical protein
MSSTVFILLLIVFGLVAVFALFVLWRKMKLGLKLAGHLAFWPVVVACIFVFTQSTSTYIVTSEGEKFVVTAQMGFGGASYEMSTGTVVDTVVPAGMSILINDTDFEMMVEAVIYGDGYVRQEDAYFEARSFGFFNSSSIDYYPAEEPPASIESSSSGAEARTWLHPIYDFGDYDEEDYYDEEYEEEEEVDSDDPDVDSEEEES